MNETGFEVAPYVSVIVRTYNRRERLRECLNSLSAQTFDSFETVVVNDCGVEVDDIIVEELGARPYRSIRNQKNRGRTAALNIGVEAAIGHYICFLDDDDIVYPNHLETLTEAAKPTGLPVVYTDVMNVTYLFNQAKNEWERVREQLVYSFDFVRDNFLLANYIPINCLMIRRDCFDAVGPFDESLHVYEDWEFLIRLSRKFDFLHIAKITGEYRRRDDNSNILEQDAYLENERVVKRRYRDDRHAVFDPIFKSTFQYQPEIRDRGAQVEKSVKQNQMLLEQLQEAQRVLQQMQQEIVRLRGGRSR